MNVTDNLPETPTKSGLILKSAREELSLTLDQVAHELHLRPSVVKAIEDEDYDEFPSDVFLKGYFRSYCRLVNLHDARMMELLDTQLLFRKEQAQLEQQKAEQVIQSKKRKKLLITLLIFSICSSLVAATYYFSSQSNFQGVVPENGNENALLATTDQGTALQGNTLEIPAIENETETKAISRESITSDINTEVNRDDSSESIKTTDKPEILKDTELEKTIDTNTVVAEETANDFLLTASFSGDCWFKLIDGSGKVISAGLKNSNDEVNFSGPPPFHIVIGDASKANLTLNQSPINLTPYTSNNGRAELILNPLEPINEG